MKIRITTIIILTNGNGVNSSKITLDNSCSNRVCVMCVFDHKSENEICSTTAAAGKRVIHLQCCHRFQKGPTHLESPPLFFFLWAADYIQVQLKVQLIQKVWTQWHAVSSENVNQFFQRKSVCCSEGSRVTLMPKAMKIVFLFRQDNVPNLLFLKGETLFPILARM